MVHILLRTPASGEHYDIDGDSAAQELETGQKEDAGIHKTSGTGCVDGSTPGLEKITDREDNEEGTNGCRHTETRPPHNDVEEGDMLAAVWAMLGTAGAASFFMAVVLSGMGAGVINTFLFIRYIMQIYENWYDSLKVCFAPMCAVLYAYFPQSYRWT